MNTEKCRSSHMSFMIWHERSFAKNILSGILRGKKTDLKRRFCAQSGPLHHDTFSQEDIVVLICMNLLGIVARIKLKSNEEQNT